MIRVFTTTVIFTALMGSVVPLQGEEEKQIEGASESDATADVSTREALKNHFDDHPPLIGSALPDVLAMDADGNEIRLGDLKGHYSVIVFGCGSFRGRVDGTFQGSSHVTIQGRLDGKIDGRFQGRMEGEFEGEFRGQLGSTR